MHILKLILINLTMYSFFINSIYAQSVIEKSPQISKMSTVVFNQTKDVFELFKYVAPEKFQVLKLLLVCRKSRP